jgi:hypothetical protein
MNDSFTSSDDMNESFMTFGLPRTPVPGAAEV